MFAQISGLFCLPFQLCIMPAKHASRHTTLEWVSWSKSEGFDDIAEDCNGLTTPGKVYCTLCAKWIGANSAAIKQHCLEYKVGSKENQKVVQSAHALKVEKKR